MTGTGNLLLAVTTVLARNQRTATRATNRAARVGKGRRGTGVTCANPRLRGGFLSVDEREAPSVLQPQLRNQIRAENCTQPDLI